jgi:hypothetical protein
MFGYVRPHKPELLVREWTRYQSVYCGICKQIGRDYGQFSRLTLGYDLTLLAVLLLALAEEQPPEAACGCISNPLRRRPMVQGGEIIRQAAALTLLLAAYKAEDNARDEHPVLGQTACLALAVPRRKAARLYPRQEQVIASRLQELHRAEAGAPDPEAAGCFGSLLGGLFDLAAPLATADPAIRAGLARFGQHLGAWIYLLDAIDDLEDDCNNGSWNPFSNLSREEATTEARALLMCHEMEMDRVAALLPYRRDAGLIGNIVTVGLPMTRDAVLSGRHLGKIQAV